MKRFIIFRTDRLGDFLIISNIIKAIKNKYKNSHITVVASSYNARIIKDYKIINKVIIYNKNNSLFDKLKIYKKIINFNYFASLSLDGKSFSNFVNIFIKARHKIGLSYKFNLINFFFKVSWSKPNFLYNKFFFDYYEYFTSKKSLQKVEHLPTLLINLANKLRLKIKRFDPYYFEVKDKSNQLAKKLYKKKIKKNYILIHLDETWIDIDNIDINL